MGMTSPLFDAMETDVSPTTAKEATEEVDTTITEETVDKSTEIEGSDTVSFYPPVYLQRYCRVREVLCSLLESPKHKNICLATGKTVMEVGCAEFGMMTHFKSLLDITKIIFVDLDEQLMIEKLHYLKPLPAEYLQRTSRKQPLVVEAYSGCVTKVDPELQTQNPSVWAIVGIEIIEHLHADVLRGFEETVFGIISPQIVIVTTPNSDFNEVFNLPPGKFRHWDHKFEWSRKEFQLWCDKIVCEFKSYMYRIEGICEGTEQTRHLGCVSQMAIFEKRETVPENIGMYSPFSSRIQSNSYKLLQTITYPNYIETRTPQKIILDEFLYFIDTFIFCRSMLNEYEDAETKEVKISLTRILTIGEIGKASNGDLVFLKDVLEKADYKTVNDCDGTSVVMQVDEYVAANLPDDISSDDEDKLEVELCQDLTELDVNRVIEEDEESWE